MIPGWWSARQTSPRIAGRVPRVRILKQHKIGCALFQLSHTDGQHTCALKATVRRDITAFPRFVFVFRKTLAPIQKPPPALCLCAQLAGSTYNAARSHTLCATPSRSTMVQCEHCGAREAPGVPSMSLCGGCFTVSYCDAKCQKADRAAHRERCNEVKARQVAHMASPPSVVGDASGLNAAALRRAADAGDAGAMGNLANCYTGGVGGVGVDLVEAFRWNRRAVEVPAPPAEAYYNLALCYAVGRGTPKNSVEAARLYKIAAEMGDADAQFNYGLCLQQGDGIPCNPVGAFTWLKGAADAGCADAQGATGLALLTGHGVTEDKTLAVVYFRRAADQGDKIAMYNLGNCYIDGAGVPRDLSLAVLWLKRAIDAGDPDASNNLAALTANLSPSEVPAMGAGVLRALLDGLGVRVPQGAEKPELVALVLARGEAERAAWIGRLDSGRAAPGR